MDQIKIGKFIAELRREKGMTQLELAEKLAVTDRSVSNWENGKCMPDLSLFKPLCDVLGITINELMSGEKLTDENYQQQLEENMINININQVKQFIKCIFIFFIFLIGIFIIGFNIFFLYNNIYLNKNIYLDKAETNIKICKNKDINMIGISVSAKDNLGVWPEFKYSDDRKSVYIKSYRTRRELKNKSSLNKFGGGFTFFNDPIEKIYFYDELVYNGEELESCDL